jgi:hypothetical protein
LVFGDDKKVWRYPKQKTEVHNNEQKDFYKTAGIHGDAGRDFHRSGFCDPFSFDPRSGISGI